MRRKGLSKRDEDREMLPFKAQRSLPQAMTIGMWSWVACDKVLLLKATRKRAWWSFQKAPYDRPLWPDVKKEFFKERRRQSQRSYSKPIGLYQGQWRLGGCKKLTGVSRQSSFFMEWRELSSNILKMGEARLHIASGNGSLLQAT